MSKLDRATWSDTSYPNAPGHVFGSATSRAGAAKIKPRAESLEDFVLSVLRGAGDHGATDAELQAAAAKENITSLLRPRRATLLARGDIKDSGLTRPNPASGVQMTVWIIRDVGGTISATDLLPPLEGERVT